MDIRKLVDINNPAAIQEQLDREGWYRSSIRGVGRMDKATHKMYRASQQRCKALQQAYVDAMFADDWRDNKYGGR